MNSYHLAPMDEAYKPLTSNEMQKIPYTDRILAVVGAHITAMTPGEAYDTLKAKSNAKGVTVFDKGARVISAAPLYAGCPAGILWWEGGEVAWSTLESLGYSRERVTEVGAPWDPSSV